MGQRRASIDGIAVPFSRPYPGGQYTVLRVQFSKDRQAICIHLKVRNARVYTVLVPVSRPIVHGRVRTAPCILCACIWGGSLSTELPQRTTYPTADSMTYPLSSFSRLAVLIQSGSLHITHNHKDIHARRVNFCCYNRILSRSPDRLALTVGRVSR